MKLVQINVQDQNDPINTILLIIENGRPITLVAPSLIVSIYYFVFNSNPINLEIMINYILLLFGVITLRLGINNVNNVYDIETDKINKPYRPIIRGDLTKESAFINGIVLQFISLFVFMLLSLEAFLLDLSFIAIAWSYNTNRGLKNIFPLNNLIIGYVRGFGYLLAVYVIGEPIKSEYILFAVLVMLYIFGSINSKDIKDIAGDKKTGRVTLPIILEGRQHHLSTFSAPFILAPIIILSILVLMGLLSPVYLLIWFIAPLDIVIIYYINKASTTKLTENTTAWLFMIITYLAHHVIFAVIISFT